MTVPPSAVATTTVDQQVWRVGFLPQPWAWPSWRYSTEGRFTGRWDDSQGTYRTMYAGAGLLGRLLEVLAPLRPDPCLAAALAGIEHNDPDAQPTPPAGQVPRSWLAPRSAATARLTGTYCLITDAVTIAALRPHFLGQIATFGLADFDASALKNARPRTLTQTVSTHLYATTDVDGVQFASRHGDDQLLWAIFERPGDGEVSPRLLEPTTLPLTDATPELVEAFRLHGLSWGP